MRTPLSAAKRSRKRNQRRMRTDFQELCVDPCAFSGRVQHAIMRAHRLAQVPTPSTRYASGVLLCPAARLPPA